MSNKAYRIHPAIGIARVGNHETSYFLGKETPDGPALELDAQGKEVPFTTYKKDGQLRRKGVRFRLFEYDEDDDGNLSNPREITANDAKITWRVEIANTKAGGPCFAMPQTEEPIRNPAVQDRTSLRIIPGARTITGTDSTKAVRFDTGKFKDLPVYLGELRTDNSGRLIFLGGLGVSRSPSGENINNFANNNDWHDDVSDGIVSASIEFAGDTPQTQRKTKYGATIIVAPPDFAPDIAGIVTMLDQVREVNFQRGWESRPTETKFRRDIFPLLFRAWQLRWTNNWLLWADFPHDWARLADPSESGMAPVRDRVYQQLSSQPLSNLTLPKWLDDHLQNWRRGAFQNDWADIPPTANQPTPDNLDREALLSAVGGGFYPGIEMGVRMTQPDLYVAPGRFDWDRLVPGDLTQPMALPWQADFEACTGSWWPAQRPDQVLVDAERPGAPDQLREWAVPIGDNPDPEINGMEDMVKNFHRLGMVVPATNSRGETVFVEVERNDDFPRPPFL